MASARDEDAIEYYIKCNVCLDPFDNSNKVPKTLACSHNVCRPCLEGIVSTRSLVNDVDLSCPECRATTRCDHGLDRLPTNNHILKMIRMNNEMRLMKLKVLREKLQVEGVVKELVKNCLPCQPEFFQQLGVIVEFIANETASLAPIWNIQNDWNDDFEHVLKLHQTVISFVHALVPQQLDYLIGDVKTRLISTGNAVERLNLFDFVCQLASATVHHDVRLEVLDMIGAFLWESDAPSDCLHHSILAFKKVLDLCWASDVVTLWIRRCIDSIEEHQRSIVAMKLLRQLCFMYASKAAANNDQPQCPNEFNQLVLQNYKQIYQVLDDEFQVFYLVVDDLIFYMDAARSVVHYPAGLDAGHVTEVEERLAFMVAFYKYGQKLVDATTAERIWITLVERAISDSDRESCFDYFSKIGMTPESNRAIFYKYVIKFDPRRMTLAAMACFEQLFRSVEYGPDDTVLYDVDLRAAIQFLWNAVQFSGLEPVQQKAYQLLRETLVYLGPRSIHLDVKVDNEHLGNCLDEISCSLNPASANLALAVILSDTLANVCNARREDSIETIQLPSCRTDIARMRFDTKESNFILRVMKREKLQGKIVIRPSADFGSIKFTQDLGDFSFGRRRKMGRLAKTSNTSVNVRMKNASFRPTAPELLNYRIWLDSERTAKACQVGITKIQQGSRNSIAEWNFVFLLQDVAKANPHSRVKPSLLFGEVVEGFDMIQQFRSMSKLWWLREGLSFHLESK